MKIGILTIHNASNHGAALQAYASKIIWSKYGSVEIVNYINPHTSKTMQPLRFGVSPRDLLRMAKDILRIIPRLKLIEKFRNFQKNNMCLKDKITLKDLYDGYTKDFNVLISGSDQLWNPAVTGVDSKLDMGYVLDFTEIWQKKIAYATSLGGFNLDDHSKVNLSSYLKNYTHISVREKTSAIQLSKILEREIYNVLDPTLMLSKNDWLSSLNIKEQQDPNEQYVLIYVVAKDELFKNIVNKITNKLNLKIIAIDQDPILGYNANKHIADAGPIDFIKLYSNATFVVTNSFHGSAFAINFEIPFLTVKPSSGANRVLNLLNEVQLENQYITDSNQLSNSDILKIDFENARTLLNAARMRSNNFIQHAIN